MRGGRGGGKEASSRDKWRKWKGCWVEGEDGLHASSCFDVCLLDDIPLQFCSIGTIELNDRYFMYVFSLIRNI